MLGSRRSAKRQGESGENQTRKTDLKSYKQIIRKKKIDFMVSRREELILLGKNNPKLFWKEL